jgi:hypothetical protein
MKESQKCAGLSQEIGGFAPAYVCAQLSLVRDAAKLLYTC